MDRWKIRTVVNRLFVIELLDNCDCLVRLRIIYNDRISLGILVCAFNRCCTILVNSNDSWCRIQFNVNSICVVSCSCFCECVCTTFKTCECCHTSLVCCLVLINGSSLVGRTTQFKRNTFYCSIVIVVLLEDRHIMQRLIVYRNRASVYLDEVFIA